TSFTLGPGKPPKSDTRAFDAMSEERAALSDADAPPATDAQLPRGSRADCARLAQEAEPDAGGVRKALPPSAWHGPGLGQGATVPKRTLCGTVMRSRNRSVTIPERQNHGADRGIPTGVRHDFL